MIILERKFRSAIIFQTQINEIKNRAVWYESVELPPEIDPNVPIDVDEEAIRNSIKRLF